MNTQEAYNRIKERAKDLRQAASPGGSICYYRCPTDPSLRCFVGALIPDNEYSPSLEGTAIPKLQQLVPTLADINTAFLRLAQRIHDRIKPSEWAESLEELGQRFDLTD